MTGWLRITFINQVVKIECNDVDTSQNISTDMITINHGQLNISIPVTADVNKHNTDNYGGGYTC